jgi:hypothetical protein
MVTINEMGREEPPAILVDDDDEDHDGWGPIRPRRSSMPPDVHADPHEHDATPARFAPPSEKPSR